MTLRSFQLKEGRFRLGVYIIFSIFTIKVVRPWHMLPRDDVDYSFLEIQGQVGWNFDQPGTVEGVSAHGRGGVG